MKKTMIELRSMVRTLLEEDDQHSIPDPLNQNASNSAKAPPGQWWNSSSQRYESIQTGHAASAIADSATKNAADPAGHAQAAAAHLEAAHEQQTSATAATERGDAESATAHSAEADRHTAAHSEHQIIAGGGQLTQPEEGQPGQPSLPVGGTAPAPKGATSNQSKRV